MAAILRSNFLPSPSVMFRNGLQRQLPEWYFEVAPLTDWPLYVVAACSGDILMIDRIMVYYTLNTTSAFLGEVTPFLPTIIAEFYCLVESIFPQGIHYNIRAARGYLSICLDYILQHR